MDGVNHPWPARQGRRARVLSCQAARVPFGCGGGGSMNGKDFAARGETPHANPRHGVCGLCGFLGVQTPTPVVHHQDRAPFSPEERSSPMAQRRGPQKRRARPRRMAPSRGKSITRAPNEGNDGWEIPFSQATHKPGEKRTWEGPPSCRAGRGRFQ